MTRRILLHMCIALDKSTPNGPVVKHRARSTTDGALFQISLGAYINVKWKRVAG